MSTNDIQDMAFQCETNAWSAVKHYRKTAEYRPLARHLTLETIDEMIRDLQEARTYALNAREIERAA